MTGIPECQMDKRVRENMQLLRGRVLQMHEGEYRQRQDMYPCRRVDECFSSRALRAGREDGDARQRVPTERG